MAKEMPRYPSDASEAIDSIMEEFNILGEQARKACEERNAIGLLSSIHEGNTANLGFVINHTYELEVLGMYEACLAEAYTASRTNNLHIPLNEIVYAFEIADRDELLAAGDPLPDGESFTVYRGVAGIGEDRRVYGFSWTANIDLARWFARRFFLPRPGVYVSDITPEDVYFFSNGREEREFVCNVRKARLLERLRRRPAT